MIPGTCPDCGSKRPLADFMADADARVVFATALCVPAPVGRLVLPYLDLHSPPGRAVSMGKLRRLIVELSELISAGSLTRNHETRAAPLAAWQHGLEQVIAHRDAGTLTLPLKGHGYLCEIVHRHAGQKVSRQQATNKPLHPSHKPFTDPEQSLAIERAHVARTMPTQPAPAAEASPAATVQQPLTVAPRIDPQRDYPQRQGPHAAAQYLANLRAALANRERPSPSPPPTDPEP